MPAVLPSTAALPSGRSTVLPGGAPPRKRRKRLKRILLSTFALAWIVGCVFALMHVFSAVRTRCAGCPECVGTAP